MAAYVIGHITVKNPDKWDQYRGQVPATIEPWQAKVVCRGKRAAVLCGEHFHTDMVVIEFPDQDAAQGWYRSPAYQALIPLRNEAAEVTLISYEE